jgi:hypothetical protein
MLLVDDPTKRKKVEESEEPIDLSKCCKILLDPKTKSIKAVCPPEVFDKAAQIKPRKITFELEE